MVNFERDASRVAPLKQIIDKIGEFLSPAGNVVAKNRRKEAFSSRLDEILQFFRRQTSFQFVASSILLAYDPDAIDLKDETKAVMIDFAHTSNSDGKIDDNYLDGLENFVKHFSIS